MTSEGIYDIKCVNIVQLIMEKSNYGTLSCIAKGREAPGVLHRYSLQAFSLRFPSLLV